MKCHVEQVFTEKKKFVNCTKKLNDFQVLLMAPLLMISMTKTR